MMLTKIYQDLVDVDRKYSQRVKKWIHEEHTISQWLTKIHGSDIGERIHYIWLWARIRTSFWQNKYQRKDELWM